MTNTKKKTQTLWGKIATSKISKLTLEYTVSNDHIIDLDLTPYDIQGSIAHVQMLHKISILTEQEKQTAVKALKEILKLWKDGKWKIKPEQEDGHTAIEQSITKKYGDIGKKNVSDAISK